jgi:hypothetical protein
VLVNLPEESERGLEKSGAGCLHAGIGVMGPDRDRFRIREIQDKIRRVLMDEWYPIGINDYPDAADEYDSYIGGIYGLISRDAPAEQISAHLRSLEIDKMGVVNA